MKNTLEGINRLDEVRELEDMVVETTQWEQKKKKIKYEDSEGPLEQHQAY